MLTCIVPDQDHYNTLTNGCRRYTLMKTEDMMKYMSIVFEKQKITFYPKSSGTPPQIKDLLADAVRHSGTPTSSKYWYRWKAYPPGKPQRAEKDWWLLDTMEQIRF